MVFQKTVVLKSHHMNSESQFIQTGTDLDWEREKVDFLQRLDLAVLDQPAQLGDWDPFLLLLSATSAATPTATSASTAPAAIAAATASAAKTAAESSATSGWSCVRHTEKGYEIVVAPKL